MQNRDNGITPKNGRNTQKDEKAPLYFTDLLAPPGKADIAIDPACRNDVALPA